MEPKTPRKRVANFTVDEKSLLAQLIKKTPIIESKLTDGKSVLKKKNAWASITAEFNSHANVHKRDTITLKRAWDNMKALNRKVQPTKRGNLSRTGGEPSDSPEEIVCMVDGAGPVNITEIKNDFDSDGALLNYVYVTSPQVEGNNSIDTDSSVGRHIDTDSTVDNKQWHSQLIVSDEDSTAGSDTHQKDNKEDTDIEDPKGRMILKTRSCEQHIRKPSNLIRREAMLRIKYLEAQKKIEIKTLKTKLETENIKKQTAAYHLEKAKLELEEVKKRIGSSQT